MPAAAPQPILVSVIVRTQARRLRLLTEALKSIADQTWSPIEVLIVEDGSDTLAPFIATLPARPGLTMVHAPIPPSGRSVAGNCGLERSTGAFLGFLDEDDAFRPIHVERLASALISNPDAGIAYARAQPIACAGLAEGDVRHESALAPVGDVPFSQVRLWRRNAIPVQAALFRRALYERLGGFDPSLDALEDWDLWIRYTADSPVLALPEVTSIYRLPRDRPTLRRRAAAHEMAMPALLAKHADRRGTITFRDALEMPDEVRAAIPFRHALSLAWRALPGRVAALLRGDP